MKKTKYILSFLLLFGMLSFFSVTQQSCSRGYGCEMQDSANQDINKKLGSAKRGDSNLFPKRMRKKMNK